MSEDTGVRGAEPAVAIDGITDVVEIGRGGFGVVYRGTEVDFGRTVAIKVLMGEFDEQSRIRFDRERLALGSLSGHPNIVTVFRSGFTDTALPFLVMEYVPGGSMADRLAATGALDWNEMARVGTEIASALGLAHASHVLHRDIKPGNILLAEDGTAKLADFGIARLQGAPETQSAVITASIAHAPPEVIGGQRPDERSDIYSLASSLYEMVLGRPAFAGFDEGSLVPMLARIVQEAPPDLRSAVPDSVATVLETALAKDPADRFQTAADFEAALRVAVEPSSNAAMAAPVDAGAAAGQTVAVGSVPAFTQLAGTSSTPAPTVAPPAPAAHVGLAPVIDEPRRPWYRSFRNLLWAWVLVGGGGVWAIQSVTGLGQSTTSFDLEERLEGLSDLPRVTAPDLDLSIPGTSVAPATLPDTTTPAPTTNPPTTPAPTTNPPTTPAPTTAPVFLDLVDTTGALSVSVPSSWAQWRNDDGVLVAAPDLAGYDSGAYVEGVGLFAGFDFSGTLDLASEILTSPLNDACELIDWDATDSAGLQTAFGDFVNCGGSGLNVFLIATYTPADGSFFIRNLQYFGDGSDQSIQRIIETTYVDHNLL